MFLKKNMEHIHRLAVPPQFRRLTRLHSSPAFARFGTFAFLRLLRSGLGFSVKTKDYPFQYVRAKQVMGLIFKLRQGL